MAQGYTGAHNSQFQTSPTGTAGGDLSGTYPNPLVAFINGVAIAADPFTQYTKLAGRTGTTNDTILSTTVSGTLTGSSVAGSNLQLRGNTVTSPSSGSVAGLVTALDHITTVGNAAITAFSVGPTGLIFNDASAGIIGLEFGSLSSVTQTWNAATGITAGVSRAVYCDPTIQNSPSGTGRALPQLFAFDNSPIFKSIGNGAASTISNLIGVFDNPSLTVTGTATLVATNVNGFRSKVTISASGVTITNRFGFNAQPITNSAGGTVTNDYGFFADTINAGATESASFRGNTAAGTNIYFLRDTGGAQSSLAGKFTTYNNIATVEQGLVPEYAEANLTVQTANKAQTTLYAVPASGAGLYRVSGYVVVTTQATTSSTMPKIQIDWTDSDSNTAVGPFDMTLNSVAVNPAVGTNSAGQNLLTTDTGTTAGTMIISARQSTNISYRTTGYASTGVTAMQYAVHVRLEAL